MNSYYQISVGDSGGPIHQWLDDHWEQVGIVSYGTGCALASHPGVYTRLSFYTEWIQSIVNGENFTNTTTTTTITSSSNHWSLSTSNKAHTIYENSFLLAALIFFTVFFLF